MAFRKGNAAYENKQKRRRIHLGAGLKSVVVGIEFSDCSRNALRQAMRVAQWKSAHACAANALVRFVRI
jgi:hypothetical protein